MRLVSGAVSSEDAKQTEQITVDLLERARNVAQRAYAPYSNLHVGAALLTEAGNVFEGCNVENASYGLTWCAERTAVTTAVAAEGPTMRIASVVLYTPDLETCSPCGACRQVLAEFGPDAKVTYRDGGELVHAAVRDLLPHAFYGPGPDGR